MVVRIYLEVLNFKTLDMEERYLVMQTAVDMYTAEDTSVPFDEWLDTNKLVK